jgi:hypothetical protein
MTNRSIVAPIHNSIFCIVAFLATIAANNIFILDYVLEDSISFTELHKIEFIQICGYITAIIMIMFFNNIYNSNMVITYNACLYWFCVLNVIIFGIFQASIFWYFCITFSGAIITISLIFRYVMHIRENNDLYITYAYFLSILSIGITLAIIKYFTLESYKAVIVLNLLSLWLLIQNTARYTSQKENDIDHHSISKIVPHIGVESFIGFVIVYVTVMKLDGYEIYIQSSSINTEYIVMLGLAILFPIVSIILMKKKYYNKNQITTYSIVSLMLLVVSLPYFEQYTILAILERILFFTCLHALFLNTIFIVIEKFEERDLFTTLLIFALSCGFGYYSAYLTIYSIPDSFSTRSFLICIVLMLSSSLAYHIYSESRKDQNM